MGRIAGLIAGLIVGLPVLGGPARAEDPGFSTRSQALRVGDLDVRLGETETRWTSAREGAIALDRNMFVFGREDTYESMRSERGLAEAERGTTIGVGLSFQFDYGR